MKHKNKTPIVEKLSIRESKKYENVIKKVNENKPLSESEVSKFKEYFSTSIFARAVVFLDSCVSSASDEIDAKTKLDAAKILINYAIKSDETKSNGYVSKKETAVKEAKIIQKSKASVYCISSAPKQNIK